MGRNSKSIQTLDDFFVLNLLVISNHANARVASSETSSIVGEQVFMTAWSW